MVEVEWRSLPREIRVNLPFCSVSNVGLLTRDWAGPLHGKRRIVGWKGRGV
jgi:hypothetical protein